MTREEAKKMLPIIKAWAEGREVEYNDDGLRMRIEGDDIQLDVPAEWYRVVPRYRPFKDNRPYGGFDHYRTRRQELYIYKILYAGRALQSGRE